MIEQIKQLTEEELAEIAKVSYLHEFENAMKLLGHIGYLIGEVERLQHERDNAMSLRNLAVKRYNGLISEQQEGPRFKMDAQGNLTLVKEE